MMADKRTAWWRGKRGEWFVVVQGGLFVLLAFGPRTIPGVPLWPQGQKWPYPVAAGLMAAGALLAFFAFFNLGRNLTPLPHPKEGAKLVQEGAYRLVRHPIYGGIILISFGWAVWSRSWLTLSYALLLALFFEVKSRREERWLREKYPDYAAYSRRVRKFIPFIY